MIESLLEKVDTLIIGGGMAFTFLKSKGYEIGKSILDAERIDLAADLIKKRRKWRQVCIAGGCGCAKEFSNETETKEFDADRIPADWMGLDVGSKTIALYREELKNAKTVIWNGPVGAFEMSNFAKGTTEVAKALAGSNAVTIIGGGDSAAAVEQFGLADQMTHISTRGGASLEFLEGKELPGIAVLQNK